MSTSAVATSPPEAPIAEPTPPMSPPAVACLEDTGLTRDFLIGLIAKTLHQRDSLTGFEIADAVALPFAIVDGILLDLQSERMLEVRQTDGPARSSYRFALTRAGRDRASRTPDTQSRSHRPIQHASRRRLRRPPHGSRRPPPATSSP